jgi:hypothetical protein
MVHRGRRLSLHVGFWWLQDPSVFAPWREPGLIGFARFGAEFYNTNRPIEKPQRA